MSTAGCQRLCLNWAPGCSWAQVLREILGYGWRRNKQTANSTIRAPGSGSAAPYSALRALHGFYCAGVRPPLGERPGVRCCVRAPAALPVALPGAYGNGPGGSGLLLAGISGTARESLG